MIPDRERDPNQHEPQHEPQHEQAREEPRAPTPDQTADLRNPVFGDTAPHRPARADASDPFPDPRILANRDDPRYDAAWNDLLRRFRPWVRRMVAAGVWCPEDRDDVEFAIWARATQQLPAALPRATVGTWLRQVVTRALATDRRARRAAAARAVRLATEFAAHQATAAEDARDRDDVLSRLIAEETAASQRAALAQFLAERTPDERALLSAWAQSVPHREIARRLGCTAGASRERLRALLRRAGETLAASRSR